MTALQAGTPWHLTGPRRWSWRASPLHLGRAERERGLSRAARCAALIAALTWAVTLTPVVQAQEAHKTAVSAVTPTAAVTVAFTEADHLAVLDFGLRKVLDDLRAGRPTSDDGGLHQRTTVVKAFPAFTSYPVLEATALAIPSMALPEHVLAPHSGALSNAFLIPPADAAVVVPVQPVALHVPSPPARPDTTPINHFPTPTPPPTEPVVVPPPGGDDGAIDPPVERPVVVVPGDDAVDPAPSDEGEGDEQLDGSEPDAPEPDQPDTSELPPTDAEPASPPASDPSPEPAPEPPVNEPEPDPVIEAPPAAAPPVDTTPPAAAPTLEERIAWWQRKLGIGDPGPTDPSDPQQLALWRWLLEVCQAGGAVQVAACVDANLEPLGEWGRTG